MVEPGVRRRGATRNERGAALVEFALVVPILLLLLFGIVEFGIAFNDYISVRNGSREGARAAVVNDVKNAPSCTINGGTVSPPAAPTSAGDATNAIVCKTKNRIGLDESQVKVKVSVAGTSIGDTVTVCASVPVQTLSGLLAPIMSGKVLTSNVTMRLEQVPKFASFTEAGTSC
jgi:Flp pilus assembly protein TadG